MTSVKRDAAADPDHVAWLLDRTFRRLRQELGDVGGRHPQLRGSHLRLLSLIPEGGARHSDLAERALMTRQALGQLAAHLEMHGYAETLCDPADGRVRVLRATAAGRRARDDAEAAIADLEQRWAASVGERRYAIFRRVLGELGQQTRE